MDAVRDQLRISVAAIRRILLNPDLRRLEIAWTLSVAAQWALVVALLVYAYDQGGTVAVGLLAAARTLPTLVGVPLATALGDRRSAIRVLLGVYLTAAVTATIATIALWQDAGVLPVFAVAAANAVATAAIRPLQMAIVPALARSPEELIATNVTSSTGEAIGLFVGPAFGGLLLAFGPVTGAAAGAVGMLLATVAFTQIRGAGSLEPGVRSAGPRPSAGILAGFGALRSMPTQRVVIAVLGVQPFVRGLLTVLIVVAAIDLLGLGDPGVGLLNAAIGAGGVIGAIGTMLLVGRHRMAGTTLIALAVWGVPIAVIGIVPIASVALFAMGVLGAANAVLDVSAMTLLQRIIPGDVRVSVLGVFEGYMAAMAAAGGILAPVLVSALGVSGAMVVAGVLLPLATLLASRPVLRADDIALVPARQAELLRGVPMFAPLSLATIEGLAGSMQPVSFAARDLLMQAGTSGDRFVLIDSGSVAIEKEGVQVATIGSGGYVGEIALLRAIPRTATVRALTDIEAFGLDGCDFIAAVTGDRDALRSADIVIGARLADAGP